MTWIHKQSPKHYCQLPEVGWDTNQIGDMWVCDECHQYWRVSSLGQDCIFEPYERTYVGDTDEACGRGICAKGRYHLGRCHY